MAPTARTGWPSAPDDRGIVSRLRPRRSDLRIELIHPGIAHTTGDTIAWLPEHRVACVGDLLIPGRTPFCFMGSPTVMPRRSTTPRLTSAGCSTSPATPASPAPTRSPPTSARTPT
jgi:hypothetical protein